MSKSEYKIGRANYMKLYREKNKIAIAKQEENYKKNHSVEGKAYRKKYYETNKESMKLKVKQRRSSINITNRKRDKKYIASWLGMIPAQTNCQCCGKELFFNSGIKMNSIHFDHRYEKANHIKNPYRWLETHPRTIENEILWKSFDFGMLCHICNTFLPTNNRTEFLDNAIKYHLGAK